MKLPGLTPSNLQGAIYLFPDVQKGHGDERSYTDVTEFTTAILEEAGVALVTGAGCWSPENIRLSYATGIWTTLKEAVRRLKGFYGKIRITRSLVMS